MQDRRFYSHSAGDCTPILLTFYGWFYSTGGSTWWFYSQLIVHLFYCWFDPHSTDSILLMILSSFYWQYSTDHSGPTLLSILLPFYWRFYSHSSNDCTPILLAFYWWIHSHSTDHSSILIYMIQLPFYGSLFHSNLHDSTPILRIIILPCALLGPVDQFYWWFYSQSTYRFILLSTDHSTQNLLTIYGE